MANFLGKIYDYVSNLTKSSNQMPTSTYRSRLDDAFNVMVNNKAQLLQNVNKDTNQTLEQTISSIRSQTIDSAVANYLAPFNFTLPRMPKTYADIIRERFFSSIPEDLDESSKQQMKLLQEERERMRELNNLSRINATQAVQGLTPQHNEQENAMFVKWNTVDTSIGGNEAINPRWGFGRDDDIIPTMLAIKGQPSLGGLGRVYSELYNNTQQILYISAGVPEYESLWKFYMNAVDGDLANKVNSGEASNIARFFGWVAGTTVKVALNIAFWPITFPCWLAEVLDPKDRITKYYELRPTMAMYYRYANSIFAQICTVMGLVPMTAIGIDKLTDGLKARASSTSGTESNTSILDLFKDGAITFNGNSIESEPELMEAANPLFFSKKGPNIFSILRKRDESYPNTLKTPKDLEEYMKDTSRKKPGTGGLFDGFSNALQATITGADKFIGFRINKSTDSSETLSNSTGQSAVAQALNSAAAAGRMATVSAGGSLTKAGNILGSIPILGTIATGIKDLVSGALSATGFGGMAAAVMTGSGFIDIPDVWLSSSFSKSFNFTFTFRPGAGDNITIAQDEYLPLSLLLALACPRTVGVNSYTSPFLLRAYCKGMFAVPLGIVDNLSITRGESDFGWNMSRLPTVLNVSMSIKDLAPIMHIAMADTSSSMAIFGSNTPMQEYVHTLAGSGLAERLLFMHTVGNRLRYASQLIRSTWLSPDYWAMKIGETAPMRIIGAVSSSYRAGS